MVNMVTKGLLLAIVGCMVCPSSGWTGSIPHLHAMKLQSVRSGHAWNLGASITQPDADLIVSDISLEETADESNYGWTDEEFEAWIASELSTDPLAKVYHEIFKEAPRCITNWRKRYRGNQVLWRRVFKRDRVLKEFLEAVPIIDAVVRLINETTEDNFTIVDLASGKGYLSMLLSELLPPEKISKFVLIDKAWPMCNSVPNANHMSWDHIYGNKTETETYFETWPIPLHTSKQDLKKGYNHRQLKKRLFDPAPGPVVILAVHLCGTLSLRAVDMFNEHENVRFFALKPCCLPTMTHVDRDEIFTLGDHSFDSKLVCAAGKWSNKQWYGPPRWHLEHRFHAWAENLFLGVQHAKHKIQTKVVVQRDGGYQNTFIFAEREPTSSTVWSTLEENDKKGKEEVSE